jgi:hypothetical protein
MIFLLIGEAYLNIFMNSLICKTRYERIKTGYTCNIYGKEGYIQKDLFRNINYKKLPPTHGKQSSKNYSKILK